MNIKNVDYSFIIPFYNTDINKLESSIKSIINQKIKSYEIILINDGSNNEILDNYCIDLSDNNKNILYIYQKNSGSAIARNNGLDNSKGKYIIFVDADDVLTDDFYYLFIKNVKNNFDFLIFDYSFWNTNNEEKKTFYKYSNFIESKREIMQNILFYPGKMDDFMFGSIWGKCFSKEYLDKNHIRFKPELRKAQDRRFMLDVIINSKNILYYPIYSYKYRTNNNSICHTLNYKMVDYYKKLYLSINDFCLKNKLDKEISKFLSYNIMNEVLPLSIFNINNKKKYAEKNKEFYELSNYLCLKENIKKIKYNNIPTKKGKIKLFLYKTNQVYLLYKIFAYKQKKERKKGFN